MIKFRGLQIEDKPLLQKYKGNTRRGCEMSFGNLFMWGKQEIAEVNRHLVFLATFNKSFYPFPFGEGDKKEVVDAIIEDAKERNIPLVITSITEEEKSNLETLYPNEFEFTTNDGSYDYVYSIDDLAELKGKKYHKKRNHLNNFIKAHPNYKVEPISEENLPFVKEFVSSWYEIKRADDAMDYEKVVFERAMDNYNGLGLEGLVLFSDKQPLAVTFASLMDDDTFDVHFEKARKDVDGAYVAINYEFARYIRAKYPNIKYLDREEDMGLEGLRKAKQSYYPHHQVIKYKAIYKG